MSDASDKVKAALAAAKERQRADAPEQAVADRQLRINALEAELKDLRERQDADQKTWAERFVVAQGWDTDTLSAIIRACKDEIYNRDCDDE